MQYRRRSIRLPGYYFVTICVYGGDFLFGKIKNNHMFLNNYGKMVNKWWLKLKKKYTTINLDTYIIMPDHLHGIIQIIGKNPVDFPDIHNNFAKNEYFFNNMTHRGANTGAPLQDTTVTIPHIVQWFKTMKTNEYLRNIKQLNWRPICGKLWQRNYYDHIIRNKIEL